LGLKWSCICVASNPIVLFSISLFKMFCFSHRWQQRLGIVVY
jgi:hypothetical protein